MTKTEINHQQIKRKYPFSHTVPSAQLGDVWNWILHSRDGYWKVRDFKWIDNTFYFDNENDRLIFSLRWP